MPLNHMELRCGDSSISVPAESPRVPADCNDSETLWVSTDLKTWCPRDPSFIARDCQINDRCYRRLDPEYFAWLKLKMHGVKAAADAGRVPAEAFDEVRQRFNEVQNRAIEAFGERTLCPRRAVPCRLATVSTGPRSAYPHPGSGPNLRNRSGLLQTSDHDRRPGECVVRDCASASGTRSVKRPPSCPLR